jgi:putative (di)nucleoside polyphosphate hydrolase
MGGGVIDGQGFRLNIGIIVMNTEGKLLWARRIGRANAWQFSQGGLDAHETLQEAMYRELEEELGLQQDDVELVAKTPFWLRYRLPERFQRHKSKPLCIGQKQRWFLLKLLKGDDSVQLDYSDHPEFDQWEWVDYWYPLEHVISFKRKVYLRMLKYFEKHLPSPPDGE